MSAVPFSGWTVAPSRTLPLAAPSQRPLVGLRQAALSLVWIPKAPTDLLDFALDPTDWLADSGDMLSSMQVVLPAAQIMGDLVALWAGPLNGMAAVFLAGGQPGTNVTIAVQIETAAGRRHTEQVSVQINAATSAGAVASAPILSGGYGIAPNLLRLADGTFLTDAAGRPFAIS
ncbi:hypothetical protein AA101099_1760 [Neoasaia chiangmaiensis NBRC 101099]|uniref:Uncharacterized protein n=1 Tax=Neoasaia chiangmaiensis TaxID=320497 RepID=A0A1U9KR09_9PROT|nr:hypothetical protein [Neoasaia chiangmaiensis]AQS88284.1 hypothetical protein A0U93_10390 [Neoasaia chiangmaiensis]GBR39657.1 hypothetical protein AA101099_1760 [Neoasaia chiangmaiensis NBRC 101099]GEN14682.1 hypothetical protein NCH01_11130 [Neoasaia chiangmaiensis]